MSPNSQAGAGRVRRAIAVLAALALLGWACSATAADPNKGRRIYMSQCQNCHGANGVSRIPGAPDFSRGDGLFRPDLEIVRAIRSGRGMMPAFEGMLTEEELLDVVAFLRTLR